MNLPKTQLQEVLYMLLNDEIITYRTVFINSGIINLTARISDLRNTHFLDVPCKRVKTVNKFGRAINYGSWSLSDPEEAKIVYDKLNKEL